MTAETETRSGGLALLCDDQGEIIELACNGLGVDKARTGVHFAHVVDEASVDKAHNLLAVLLERGVVFD